MHLDPKDAISHNNLGIVYQFLGKYEESAASFRQATRLDPKDAYPHNNLGTVYRFLGKYEEAMVAFRKAMQLDLKLATPHYNLARIYIHQRTLDDARQELSESIRLAPENTFAPMVALGIIDFHANLAGWDQHFRGAIEQWDKAWRMRKQTPWDLLADKAKALVCLGNKNKAVQTLQAAIAQMLPGDVIAFDDYELLQTAPVPPDGIEEMVALLKEAQAKRS